MGLMPRLTPRQMIAAPIAMGLAILCAWQFMSQPLELQRFISLFGFGTLILNLILFHSLYFKK